MIFETVEILVALAAHFAAVRLLFLHSQSAGIRRRGLGVDDRKGAVGIVVQLLVVVTVLENVSSRYIRI